MVGKKFIVVFCIFLSHRWTGPQEASTGHCDCIRRCGLKRGKVKESSDQWIPAAKAQPSPRSVKLRKTSTMGFPWLLTIRDVDVCLDVVVPVFED